MGQRFTKCSLDEWDVEFKERATGLFEPFCSFAFFELLKGPISVAVTAGQPFRTCCDCLRGRIVSDDFKRGGACQTMKKQGQEDFGLEDPEQSSICYPP